MPRVSGILVPKTIKTNLVISVQAIIDNVGDVFFTFFVHFNAFSCVPYPQVVQKHTLGEVGT